MNPTDTSTNAIAGAIAGARRIVAVASGKGGVGKSTTAVNLALALQGAGQKIGILDADIYGPSLPTMLGISDRPQVQAGNRLVPLQAHGLQVMSIGLLTTAATPMVWRGPMASSALTQILTQTLWQGLDILLVDLPPGTGDIPLTLAQKAAVDGAIIVTTPQEIALLDAVKGIEMFRKVAVPVLGLVENMAVHRCPQCGYAEPIFGQGGAARVAEQYAVPVLGSLPLDSRIRADLDAGTPTPISDPSGELTAAYGQIATACRQRLDEITAAQPDTPEIVID